MTMITPSYLGETIEYSSLHACRSTLEDPTELLLNAVEWGGKLDPNLKVRIARIRYPRMLLYRVADPGSGFSFKDLTHAAVDHTSPESIARVAVVRAQLGMRPGGFGIAMARAMADELLYNEAQNEVISRLRIGPLSIIFKKS